MSTQLIQNQTGAKCPHGFPVGACPICSSMGGGVPKDRNKPRVAGEMSYNECMAAWLKIQAQKEAKIQDRIDKREAYRAKLIENRKIEASKINNIIDKIIEPLPAVIKTPLKAIVTPIVNFILKIPIVIKTVQNVILNIQNFVLSAAEKLSTALGEAKNFIQAFFNFKDKKKIKTLLSLFTESDEEDKEDKERIKKLFKNIFKIKKDEKDELA